MGAIKEIIRIGQTTVTFLLEGKDTNEELAMFEFTVPTGGRGPIPHYHEHYDETIYGLEGVVTFTVNGKQIEIGPGDTCFIPRGAVHVFNNTKDTDARALAVCNPAKIGPDFFRESGDIINAGGQPDIEKLKQVFAKNGIVPVMK